MPELRELRDAQLEVILPDTIYTSDITIGPDIITYYDEDGEKRIILGHTVSPDAPWVWDPEGRLVRTSRQHTDIIRIGQDITIDEDERVDGNVVAIAGSIWIKGEVKGDVVAVLGNVTVDGYVHGSAVSPLGTVIITPDGRVREDAIGSVINDLPGSRLGGEPIFTHVHIPVTGNFWGVIHGSVFFAHIPLAIFLIFLVLLGHVFAGKNIAMMRTRLSESSVKCFFLGLLMKLIGLPVLFILLLITVVGIPVAILVLPLVVLIADVLGYAAFGLLLGEKVKENTKMQVGAQLGQTITGVVALLLIILIGGILAFIPFGPLRYLGLFIFLAGHIISFVATTAGFGAAVLTRMGTRLRPVKKQPVKPLIATPIAPRPDDSALPST